MRTISSPRRLILTSKSVFQSTDTKSSLYRAATTTTTYTNIHAQQIVDRAKGAAATHSPGKTFSIGELTRPLHTYTQLSLYKSGVKALPSRARARAFDVAAVLRGPAFSLLPAPLRRALPSIPTHTHRVERRVMARQVAPRCDVPRDVIKKITERIFGNDTRNFGRAFFAEGCARERL